ncbi:extracellular solute-binding protein [Paenibacillus eucommiae]|uniref:Aldouronate transport system substrate-binding protein n=1 Tax=Paenibacillus eucommiae TaxID=1355755 RepID=A0ABS4J5M8_9BACL|nr:extracellular solute-binding protein [Paenibacillus eucommiae]MBP1995115.1 putative aldouronate transport system substrate-binding protein [Paenibacillus eucommiae]
MQSKAAKWIIIPVWVLLIALVSACRSDLSDESKEAGMTPATVTEESNLHGKAADPLGKYDPPIEVTAIRQLGISTKFAAGESIEKNAWNQLYEDEFGIKLKYLWVADPSQYNQKFNILLASGKLPDIMPVDGTQFKQLVEADMLADLTEALENYGLPITKQLLNKDGGMGLESATFDGKLLGIPVTASAVDEAPLLWVRTDWLQKLNLPEPQTMDDVFRIAEAFSNQDPDGNHKKDTYGLALDKGVFGLVPGLQGFFNSYHAYPQIWVEDQSGNYVYGSIQPEMKEALVKLNQMYQTGQIDREFGVKDAEKIYQDINAGKLGMLYGLMYAPTYFADGKKLDAEMEWKPFPLPSIDASKAKPQLVFNVGKYYVVKKGMKHPEAVVKMLNAFSNDWDRSKYPLTAINQDGDISKWLYALVAGSNPTQNLEMYERVSKALEAKDETLLDPKAPGQRLFYDHILNYKKEDINSWGYLRIYDAQGLLYDYNKKNGFLMTAYTSGPSETMVEKDATLKKMEIETFTKIIMGEDTIEAFDTFVENWKMLGGDIITAEVEQWKQENSRKIMEK